VFLEDAKLTWDKFYISIKVVTLSYPSLNATIQALSSEYWIYMTSLHKCLGLELYSEHTPIYNRGRAVQRHCALLITSSSHFINKKEYCTNQTKNYAGDRHILMLG